MTLEEIISKEEKQVFDRKSADIDAKALAITIVAFANADGGDIAIGISDKTRRIDGADYNVKMSMNYCGHHMIFASRLFRWKFRKFLV